MNGRYLYGLTRARTVPAALRRDGVSLLAVDGRAAIVSPADPAVPVEPTRRNLLAHARILEELHEHATVLPARFGLVLPDEDAVRALLATAAVEQLLDEHEGRAEVTLRASYDETIVAHLARGLGPLRAAYRDAPTLENGLALGEAVSAELAARREQDLRAILDAVEPFALDVRVGEPQGEHAAAELSLLVRRDAVDAVERALEPVAAGSDPPLRFRLVGPLPPYSFVDVPLPVAA